MRTGGDRQREVEVERRLADGEVRDHLVEGALVGRVAPASAARPLPSGRRSARTARDGARRCRPRTARRGRARSRRRRSARRGAERDLVDLAAGQEREEDGDVSRHAPRRRPVVGEADRADGGLGLGHRDDQGGAACHARQREARAPDRQSLLDPRDRRRITEVEQALRERVEVRDRVHPASGPRDRARRRGERVGRRRDPRLLRRRDLQRGAERRGRRGAVRVPAGRRHERPAACARRCRATRSRRRGPPARRSPSRAGAPHLARRGERPALLLLGRGRLRRGGRPPPRRARSRSGRGAPGDSRSCARSRR